MFLCFSNKLIEFSLSQSCELGGMHRWIEDIVKILMVSCKQERNQITDVENALKKRNMNYPETKDYT